jgi:quercetin dioxygenase-like cupin family protein
MPTAAPAREIELVCGDFESALDLLRDLGLRLDVIYPADEPHTAVCSDGGHRVRLTSTPDAPLPSAMLPEFQPEFVLTPAGAAAAKGRAGMLYRDLVPSRLGGRYIASHIAIPHGGPVADWVHFHRIAVQMIYVRSGWVRLVYEGQGEPFVAEARDLILQPPGIRHRVLESSPGLEVVEITCPALHETFADHELGLPNGRVDQERDFEGQRFLHHVAAQTAWTAVAGGGEAQETAVVDATRGLADARTLRRGGSSTLSFAAHDGELVFGFVLDGSARLDHKGDHGLGPADAFVIPPGEPWRLRDASADLRLLQVTTARLS